jgi:hypothetical protein
MGHPHPWQPRKNREIRTMTFVTLSGGYVEPNIGVGKEFFSQTCAAGSQPFPGQNENTGEIGR